MRGHWATALVSLTLCSGKQSSHPSASIWVPDSFTQRCMHCYYAFTMLYRRHHCRVCGSVVCHRCSENSESLPQFGYSKVKPERVCDACFSRDRALERDLGLYVGNQSTLEALEHQVRLISQAKGTEGFPRNLLQYSVSQFRKRFLIVFSELSKLIDCTPFPNEDGAALLEEVVKLLDCWSEIEEELPGISRPQFLAKARLLENRCFPGSNASNRRCTSSNRRRCYPGKQYSSYSQKRLPVSVSFQSFHLILCHRLQLLRRPISLARGIGRGRNNPRFHFFYKHII